MLDLVVRVIGLVFLVVLGIAIAAGSSAAKLSKDFPWQFRLAARFRTPILMFIVVPLSFLYWLRNQFVAWKRRVLQRKNFGFANHHKRVSAIVDQIKAWDAAGRQRPMRTARANWQAMSTKLSSNKGDCHLIQTRHLNLILDVDTTSAVPSITVEPSVTMGDISDVLAPMGYALEVNVEMESITVGGVALGFGMEVNSHKGTFSSVFLPRLSCLTFLMESCLRYFPKLGFSRKRFSNTRW